MHRIIRRLGEASARRPRVTIGAWAVAVALVLGLAETSGGALVDDLNAPDSSSERAAQLLEEPSPQAGDGTAPAHVSQVQLAVLARLTTARAVLDVVASVRNTAPLTR